MDLVAGETARSRRKVLADDHGAYLLATVVGERVGSEELKNILGKRISFSLGVMC